MNKINLNAEMEVNRLLDSDPILFLGSGMSIPPYRDWQGMLEDISARMNIALSDNQDMQIIAQELYNQNPEQFNKAVIDVFLPKPTICRSALIDIMRLKFKSVLTTNYDQTIDFALNCADRNDYSSIIYPNLQASLCKYNIVHYVHGKISESISECKIVLHKDSYQDAYFIKQDVAKYLFDVFFDNNIIFVGYSLNNTEPLIKIINAVSQVKEKIELQNNIKIQPKNWSILLPINDGSKDNEARLKMLNVNIIYYDQTNETYDGLDELWSHVQKKRAMKSAMALSPPIINPLSDMTSDWDA